MQTMSTIVGRDIIDIEMPAPDAIVFDDVQWGNFDEMFTAAFWCGQTRQSELLGIYQPIRLGRSLREEMAACLLGGFGMKAEIGLAAFWRLRDEGLLLGTPGAEKLEERLSRPIEINGRAIKYRYPRQKAKYLSACLRQIDRIEAETDDVAMRDQLTMLPGIGPKTASWIVRNWRSSDQVAILDIHILRAGAHIGVFPQSFDVTKHYKALEAQFLRFARCIGVRASVLDNVIWDYFRRSGHLLGAERTRRSARTSMTQQHSLALV